MAGQLLVCLLVLLLYQPARADLMIRKHPYLCETASPQLDIKRFFLGYEGAYLVQPSQTMFFFLPIVYLDTYRSEQGPMNRTRLVFRSPMQFTNRVEPESSKKVVGYWLDNYANGNFRDQPNVVEIHLNESNPQRAGEFRQVLFNQLNQPDGDLGRVDMSKIDVYMNRIKEERIENGQFLMVLITRAVYFMLKISPAGGGTDETYEFCNVTHSQSAPTGVLFNCAPRTTRHIDEKIKFFLYILAHNGSNLDRIGNYVNEQGRPVEIHSKEHEKVLHLMQIDSENQVHFRRRELTVSSDEIRIREEYRVSFTFDELLSCHSPFSREREVKGIYVDPGSGDFYVIIKRFFIRIEEDLVKTGFRLEEQVYAKAQQIKTSWYARHFELAGSKWVKTTRKKSYMVTSLCRTEESCRNIYDLSAEAFRINNFTVKEGTDLIVNCTYNTLNIDGKLFCFQEQHYYFFVADVNRYTAGKYAISDRLFRISDIFNNTSIDYDAELELKFIFNYKNDTFVFMTQESLFVFRYDRFRVNENNEIVTNYSSDERVPEFENHLFQNVKSLTPRRVQNLGFYVKLLVLLLAVILVLVIIYDVFISRQMTFGQLLQKCCMRKADSPPDNAPDRLNSDRDVKLRESFDSVKTSKEMNSLVSGAPLKKSSSIKKVKSGQKLPSSEKLRPSLEQRRPSSEQKRPSSEQRRPSSEQRRPSSEQRRPSSEQRRPSSEQRRPSSEQQPPSQPPRRISSIRFVDPKR